MFMTLLRVKPLTPGSHGWLAFAMKLEAKKASLMITMFVLYNLQKKLL
jgi:hypothetical protein